MSPAGYSNGAWRLAGLAMMAALPLMAQLSRQEGERIRQLQWELPRVSEWRQWRADAAELKLRAQRLRELAEVAPEAVLPLLLDESAAEALREAAPEGSGWIERRGSWRGRVRVQVSDDFEAGQSRAEAELVTAEGAKLRLFMTSEAGAAPCEGEVEVRGVGWDGVVLATGFEPGRDPLQASSCSLTGMQNTAVLLLSFPSTPLPAYVDAALLQTAIFGAQGRSLDTYWREVSYGRTSLSGAVFGPFVLDGDHACSSLSAIWEAAIRAAQSTVNLTQYTRVILVVPNNAGCAVGIGSLGCWYSSATQGSFRAAISMLRADYLTSNDAILSVVAHEAGHGLGLNHSSSLDFGAQPLGMFGGGTVGEYGDVYSVMGSSYRSGNTYLLGHYSAPHKYFLGWFPAPANVQTVETAGTQSISPLETQTIALQGLRVRRGAGNNAWVWVEYRRPVGFDSTLSVYNSQFFNGVLVHYEDPSINSGGSRTHLLDFHPAATPNNFNNAQMSIGQTWSDPYSPLRLTVNGADATAASVSVAYEVPCATPAALAVTESAVSPGGSLGVSAAGNCTWAAGSMTNWITLTGGQSGAGAGLVTYTLTPNTGSQSRVGTLIVGRQRVTITQLGNCSVGLMPASASVAAGGGTGSVAVASGVGCGWTAVSHSSWIAVTAGVSGSGNGTVQYQVATNQTGAARTGSVLIGGAGFTVQQSSMAVSAAVKVGAYSSGYWILDLNGNFVWDGPGVDRLTFWSLGRAGEVPVRGDWNGDGRIKTGLYVDGTWQLDYNGNGVYDGPVVDRLVYFGGAGYTPVVGDWSGSGWSKIGAHLNGTWLLDLNGNFGWDGPGTDRLIYFGGTGFTPVVGDWNGSGSTKIGAYLNGLWLLDYNGNVSWDGPSVDKLIFFGGPGYTPLVGDWNGSRTSKIGAYQNGQWVLDQNGSFLWDGLAVDRLLYFGGAGYVPVLGDWNGSGTTKVGCYRDGQWVVDYNGNYAWDPPTDQLLFFGGPGQFPITGNW